MKKLLVLLLVVGFMLSFTGGALADDRGIIIDPQSSNIFIAYSSNIWLQSGSIMCSSTSETRIVTNQSITMELQRLQGQSWVTISTWQKTVNHHHLNVSEKYLSSPGSYRVKGTHLAGGETKISFSAILNI